VGTTSGSGKRTLAIIGMGSFGRFMARHLSEHFELVLYEPRPRDDAIRPYGRVSDSLAAVAEAGRVAIATPVASYASVLRGIAPLMRPGSLVIDVASVKVRPLALMGELLPPHVEYLGTHPLFGPQSGAGGLAGLKVAVCPGRCRPERLGRIRRFLADTLELRVLDVDPEEHDRQMAYVQGLTHLVGWAFKELGPPDTELSTLAYERLLSLKTNVEHDSDELFATIQRENPFAREVRQAFVDSLSRLVRRIEET